MDDAMGRYIPGQIKKPGALKQEAFMGAVCLETRVLVSSCLEGGVGMRLSTNKLYLCPI